MEHNSPLYIFLLPLDNSDFNSTLKQVENQRSYLVGVDWNESITDDSAIKQAKEKKIRKKKKRKHINSAQNEPKNYGLVMSHHFSQFCGGRF